MTAITHPFFLSDCMAVLLHDAHSRFSSPAFLEKCLTSTPSLTAALGHEGDGILGRMVGIGTETRCCQTRKLQCTSQEKGAAE
jgi:hypothetical protein